MYVLILNCEIYFGKKECVTLGLEKLENRGNPVTTPDYSIEWRS